MNTISTNKNLAQASLFLSFLGFFGGLIVSFGLLAGDELGRVNLLLLLALFAFLPVVGLLLSFYFLLRNTSKGLSGWILELPLWPRPLATELINLELDDRKKTWLFYQTQLLTLCFACGSIIAYVILLLISDISFIWRSTILQAEDLLPLLELLATPWLFWSAAQPSLELIEQTRDFRAASASSAGQTLGLWWQYIFAAQLSYNLLPRSLMLLLAKRRLQQRASKNTAQSADQQDAGITGFSVQHEATVAAISYTVLTPYALADGANAPSTCYQLIESHFGKPASIAAIDVSSQNSELDCANQSIIVLVKSWEPPLAELGDYLLSLTENSEKYLLPMDWDSARVNPIRDKHLQEWRRFCGSLNRANSNPASTAPNWKLLQLEAPS